MSNKSNNQGRAYEYVCLHLLLEKILEIRPAKIIENSSYIASQKAWNSLERTQQVLYKLSAESTIETIFALEPNIVEVNDEFLALYIQPDECGRKGDVRDIIIERKDIVWEIGLSVKHNHFAVKHSRIAKTLDFGKEWYGVQCSDEYWENVKPIFDFLEEEKNKGTRFSDLDSKEEQVYLPLLSAFIFELKKQIQQHKSIPLKLVKYLLGRYDFYKIISVDDKRLTIIQSFNMFGTLNKKSQISKPKIILPKIKLPEKLLYVDFKDNSKTTIIMGFDNGWQFSFRIHNASTFVEPSLKFDIQLIGIPVEVDVKFNCKWREI